jgi:hypothetical protein
LLNVIGRGNEQAVLAGCLNQFYQPPGFQVGDPYA